MAAGLAAQLPGAEACVYSIRAHAFGRTWVGSTTDPLCRSGDHARDPPPRFWDDAKAAHAPGESRADALRRLCAFSVVSWHPTELNAQLAETALIHTLKTTDPHTGYSKLKGKPTWARIFGSKKGRPPPRK